jgi:hypothetical protein
MFSDVPQLHLVLELNMSQKKVVHAALSRLVIDASTTYPPDDGHLTKKQVAALRKDAKKRLPNGITTSKKVLFAT